MRNKIVGYMIIGLAIVLGLVIFTYNRTLLDISQLNCPITGPDCPHLKESNQQLAVNLVILGVIVLIGFYMIFFSQEERIITKIKKVNGQTKSKKFSKQNYAQTRDELNNEEKAVFEKIIESEGTAFQSDIVDKTGFHKVKVTRILDKLEGKGLIERRRRGMTNIVILKH